MQTKIWLIDQLIMSGISTSGPSGFYYLNWFRGSSVSDHFHRRCTHLLEKKDTFPWDILLLMPCSPNNFFLVRQTEDTPLKRPHRHCVKRRMGLWGNGIGHKREANFWDHMQSHFNSELRPKKEKNAQTVIRFWSSPNRDHVRLIL